MSDDKKLASQQYATPGDTGTDPVYDGKDPMPAPINPRFDGERLPPDEQPGYSAPVTQGPQVGQSDRERVPEDER